MKIALSFICFAFVLIRHAISIDIKCNYSPGNFGNTLSSAYYCAADRISVYTHQDVIIDNISGVHQNGKNNDDVLGFGIYGTNVPYFLKNLEKHFKNLKAILFHSCQLKVVLQSDLMPFPNIIGLYLYVNDIEVIEEGLFDYNPNLIEIYLQNNKIVHIHANVFDNLSKLSYLYLNTNTCINKDATDSGTVKAVIQEIKSQNLCQSIEFMSIESKLKILENNLKPMNSKSFKEQLEKLKAEFKYSKFSKFSPFDDRLESLKISTYAEHCNKSNQSISVQEISHDDNKPFRLEDMSSNDDKIKNLDETLADFQSKIDALSSKVSSIAEIVEQLEDKLGKMIKTVNIKVTVDV